MLTVETEANGDSWSTMKGVLSQLVCWARYSVTIDFCPTLAATLAHYFTFFAPITQPPGQAAVPGNLSVNLCLWFHVFFLGGGGVKLLYV